MNEPNCTLLLSLSGLRHVTLTRLLTLFNVTLTRYDAPGRGGAAARSLEVVPSNRSAPAPGDHVVAGVSQDARGDFHGAVKFTVAVILLYGVGLILMLAFYTKRNKWEESSERHVTRWVRHLDSIKTRMEKKEQKTRIENLVRNIHSDPLREVLVMPQPPAASLTAVPSDNKIR